MEKESFEVITSSVLGASHKKIGLGNQDAIRYEQKEQCKLPIILAVADGHGSKKSFRSERGSDFAVKVAVNTFREFVNNLENQHNYSSIKRLAEEKLPSEIVLRWNKVVSFDLQVNPLSDDEENIIQGKNPTIAYGTTLLGIILTSSFLICLQIGDGDIIVVTDENTIERPIPKDPRLLANETTSLCNQDAWKDFHCSFKAITKGFPSIIMVSTDGYSNSFADDENFYKVALDIQKLINEKSAKFISENLETWLNEASFKGSGDDITVGLIAHANDD